MVKETFGIFKALARALTVMFFLAMTKTVFNKVALYKLSSWQLQ
jgi:hypothetical protein